METTLSEELKALVRESYTRVATQTPEDNATSCCGNGPRSMADAAIMAEDYSHLNGYNPEADLGLGCGLPTQFAHIQPGDTVIDLGSGAGNDCFIARHETGPTGKVIGIDFTPAMIARARYNAERLKFNNVEFREGDIEHMPVSDNVADVVVSNCVLNLVPDKAAVFKEIFRVLRPGGHFSISDIVITGKLPAELLKVAEMYAGCVAGAINADAYLQHIEDAGFIRTIVQKYRVVHIPDEILLEYISAQQLADLKASGAAVVSITVFAEKPGETTPLEEAFQPSLSKSCCTPGGGCC